MVNPREIPEMARALQESTDVKCESRNGGPSEGPGSRRARQRRRVARQASCRFGHGWGSGWRSWWSRWTRKSWCVGGAVVDCGTEGELLAGASNGVDPPPRRWLGCPGAATPLGTGLLAQGWNGDRWPSDITVASTVPSRPLRRRSATVSRPHL